MKTPYSEPEPMLLDVGESIQQADLDTRDRRRAIMERQFKRLVAQDLDTTGDWQDRRLAANPLFAFDAPKPAAQELF
jgi:hypothetical protein